MQRPVERVEDVRPVERDQWGRAVAAGEHFAHGASLSRYRGGRERYAVRQPCSVTAMGSTGVAASLAFIAGLGGAVQIATQGRLGDRIGSIEALTCAVLIGAALAFVVLLLARRSVDGLREGFTGPKWMLLGGVMGVGRSRDHHRRLRIGSSRPPPS